MSDAWNPKAPPLHSPLLYALTMPLQSRWPRLLGGLFALLILTSCTSQATLPSPTATAEPTTTTPPTLAAATMTPKPLPPSPTPSPTAPPPTPTPPPPTSTLAPTPTAPAALPIAPETVSVQLEPFLTLPNRITYLTNAGDGSQRLFVVEKAGRVRIVDAGALLETPFLDISDLVDDSSSEQGLLSIAFPPDYGQTGEFYVNYTARASDGGTVIARYRVSADDPNRADPASAQIVLAFAQPAPNHNGGQMQFGPDGYLYIGTGDGGAAGDPWDNAENLQSVLGKMLRLDVRGQEDYAIPPDNPFAGQAGSETIWAYGLRNPWRFSFDRLTGDLYIGDVGQGSWEEVNFVAAGAAGGIHFGWDTMEGRHCFEPSQSCETAGKVMPVAEYSHSQGCSITGGYVYRGQRLPALNGVYLYGDYCSGLIWGLWQDADGEWQSRLLLETGANIASFGEDEAGELYVLDLSGAVYRLAAR